MKSPCGPVISQSDAAAQALWGILLSDAESDKGSSGNLETRIREGIRQPGLVIGRSATAMCRHTPAEIAEKPVHIWSCLTAVAGPDGASIRIF